MDGSLMISNNSESKGELLEQAVREIKSTYGGDVSVTEKRKSLLKFGQNESIGTSVATVMTLPGSETEEPLGTTNAITTVVSSSTSDTQDIEFYEGHTISGTDLTFIKETNSDAGITLTGRTAVTLPTAVARATRARLSSPANGDIYFYEGGDITNGVPDDDTEVHMMISSGQTQTQKASTSMSSVDYWIITGFTVSVLEKTASFADARIEIKGVSETRWFPISQNISASATSGTMQISFDPYIIVTKNHDVRVSAKANTSGIHVSSGIMGYLASIT